MAGAQSASLPEEVNRLLPSPEAFSDRVTANGRRKQSPMAILPSTTTALSTRVA